ncbi:MAG: CPBP family intramembrane glutamic endopeptidase [Coprobacillus sp.]
MLNVLQANRDFNDEIIKYQRIDSVLAVVLFVAMCLLYGLIAMLESNYSIIKENSILFGSGLNLLMIFMTILFLKIRKQSMSSIGIGNGNWKQSCLIGIVIATFLFYSNCLSHVLDGSNLVAVSEIVKFVIYYFTVALCEEIVFRGYISTRLYGIIKNQYLVIVISGLLFIIMHFPYRMIAYGMTISGLTIYNMGWILDLFITHTVLSFIYLKTNSLYGSIISHWMSSLAYNLIVR